jgi:NAD(P)H dehydrogenase (quinone)
MIAVSGASGQLGRLVLGELLERVDAAQLVAISRTPERIPWPVLRQRQADFDDPESLVRAFDGVTRLLLISTNVITPAGRRTRQHSNAIHAAVQANVAHVLYTSITRADDPAHPAAVAVDHRVTEAVLAESGLTYTVLRHNIYSHLVLVGMDLVLRTGMLLDNSGGGAIGYVLRDDCAAVAATILADGGYEDQRLEITGPRALTHADVTALITEFTGVPVRYVPISDDETVADLVAHGMPEPDARRFATIGVSTRAGYNDVVTDAVHRVTGREPTSVADVLANWASMAGLHGPPADPDRVPRLASTGRPRYVVRRPRTRPPGK